MTVVDDGDHYPQLPAFLTVKAAYDSDGLFRSDWCRRLRRTLAPAEVAA